MKADKYVYASRGCWSKCSKREARGDGLAGVACGKIKGGREVRIRLSRRMLELLSDFLARIMEHSLKKAFARARATGIPGRCCSLVSSAFPPARIQRFLPHSLATTCFRLLLLLLFSRAGFLIRSIECENSKPLADERDET